MCGAKNLAKMALHRKPRVLIGVPTYIGKDYCFQEFVDTLFRMNTDGFDVRYLFADNTLNTKSYAKYIADYTGHSVVHCGNENQTLNERLAETHNALRSAAIKMKADYLFHIESDVLVPQLALHTLYAAKKAVASGLYQIGNGGQRVPLIHFLTTATDLIHFGFWPEIYWRTKLEEPLMQVFTTGIGCILIKNKILQRFPFRKGEHNNNAPDGFWTQDLATCQVEIYADTTVFCRHANDLGWGRLGINDTKLNGYESTF
jgi:hypothetical protein